MASGIFWAVWMIIAVAAGVAVHDRQAENFAQQSIVATLGISLAFFGLVAVVTKRLWDELMHFLFWKPTWDPTEESPEEEGEEDA